MKIMMLTVYFGRLPQTFKLLIESMRHNSSVDFLIITDNELLEYDVPANVKVDFTTFEKFKRNRVSKVFKKYKMLNPYKISDYKPMFGVLFSEELTGYDYWGFMDSDIVLGDIRTFVTDELLKANTKLYSFGHFQIYKNNDAGNNLFKVKTRDFETYQWEDVAKFNQAIAFDEWSGSLGGGLSRKLYNAGFSYYDNVDYLDVYSEKYDLFMVDRPWNLKPITNLRYIQGRLLAEIEGTKREFLYVHFQKRQMKVRVNRFNEYSIYQSLITDSDEEIISDQFDKKAWEETRRKRVWKHRAKMMVSYEYWYRKMKFSKPGKQVRKFVSKLRRND